MASKSCSHCLAPLLLRLALGVVFIWAGVIKVAGTKPVKGEDAATLANMGVLTPTTATVTTPAHPSAPSNSNASPSPGDSGKSHGSLPIPSEPLPSTPAEPAAHAAIVLTGQGAKPYTAGDFPDEVNVKPLYGIALTLHKAAATTDADGKVVKPYWPDYLAHDRWPVWLAWTCAATELAGGACVLLGLLTRFWAMGLAINMGTALWLTQIGPALASGKTQLGFLPQRDWFDGAAWTNFNYTFVLLLVSLAVLGLGAGRSSVDRILFPPPPPPAKPKDGGAGH
jgi:uncharacterized membrane protein YphA (DoxX/SURF4 family)